MSDEDDGVGGLFASEERDAIEEREFTVAGVTVRISAVPSQYQHGGATALMLWPASSVLNHFLAAAARDLSGSRRLIELGAGVGLNSIVAARLLPGVPIVVTDGDEESVTLIARNCARNDCAVQCAARLLRWGADEARALAAALAAEQNEPSPLVYDHVFGSDLIYHPASLGPLFATADALLAPGPAGAASEGCGGVVETDVAGALRALRAGPCFVLAYTTRSQIDPDDVPREARARGFPRCLRLPVPLVHPSYPGNSRLTHLLLFPRQ